MLEAGYLSTQGRQRGTALIQAIMDSKPKLEPYHNLVLAAECLRDVGLARVESDLWHEVQHRLRREFERPLRQSGIMKRVWQAFGRRPTQSDAIRRRAVAAEALARIESGRSGTQPAFWRLPYGEPVLVEVLSSEFWMGNDGIVDEEIPAHQVFLESFQIAKVPITNAQYHLFVEATGHNPPEHWEDGRPPRDLESHPVVYISRHDALAYCRWLAEMTGKPITLPSEAQWEKAARGHRDHRMYPWGDSWDQTKCNSSEMKLGETIPAGIFPDGASIYGCLDMVGNVWELTSSHWGQLNCEAKIKLGYPDDPTDGREKLEVGNEMLWALRGGSFLNDRYGARCTSRVRPGHFERIFSLAGSVGFRVVASPISSPLPFDSLSSGAMGPSQKAK